jgi:aminopeptidase N
MRTLLRLSVFVLSVVHAIPARADTYPRQPGVDAIHYMFRLRVSDSSNEIQGEMTGAFRLLTDDVQTLYLDLVAGSDGKGMTVSKVSVQGKAVPFSHEHNRLRIPVSAPAGSDVAVTVSYHGTPLAGLKLVQNIHGERTIFSDNWPDNARHWLPMIDHPYDKATGEFIVTAPAHYQVVANGLLVEEVDVPHDERRTHWRQSVPIASWLYALGVARFSVHHYDVVRGIPQQVWAFPQDRDKAHELFELTGRRAFEYFSDSIGPYSYEKLAHVEAAAVSGGMEQASAIFYGEKGVTAGRGPVVHEVAHQWFGNSVTEKDWDDVWLSEGFATYFTHLFTEQFSGHDAFVRGLKNDVNVILEAQREAPDQPVIHRNLNDMTRVLNRLVYQKAGWVLHMLRGLMGTEKFWQGVREYYRRYRNINVSTEDFRQVMQQASGVELQWFFDQWLKRPGLPKLAGAWSYNASAKRVELALQQVQAGPPYRLPLDIGLVTADGQVTVERVELATADGHWTINSEKEPASLAIDPHTWTLLESANVTRSSQQ